MKALKLYRKCASVTKTIQTLGYPSGEMPFQWEKSGDGKELRDHLDRIPQLMQLSIEEKKMQ